MDGPAYFDKTVHYVGKMFMKSITGMIFHKHFMCVIYSPGRIRFLILKTMQGRMYAMDRQAHFDRTVHYMYKMFMK
jgi:hypothetical protein